MTGFVTLTRSMLAGIVAFSIMMVYLTWSDIPAYEDSTVVIFVWVAVVGIVGYVLLADPDSMGYGVSIFAGLLSGRFVLFLLTGLFSAAPGVPFFVEVLLTLTYSGFGVVVIIVGGIGLFRVFTSG